MVRLRSGLAAGEDEGLQASDAGTSTGQPPVVPNDQERIAALEQLVNQLVQQNAIILQRLAAPNEERNSEVPNNDSHRVNNDVELSQIGGQQRSHHHRSSEWNTTRLTDRLAARAQTEQVFLQIQDDASLKWPPKLKAGPTKRSRDKYCRFHRDHGHNTEDCFDLKNQIENLVCKGHLRKFTTRNRKGGSNPAQEGRDDRPPQHQPIGEIKVISGGFAGGGETSSARRAYAKRIRSFSEVNEVGMTSLPTKLPRVEEPVITFSEEDDKGIHQPHDDPLVVSMVVANFTVRRILIDNGSSADILFLRAYEKLKIGQEKL
ncbi:uncharacterized protein LOC132272473 [Cornus florida]|uniref:uncharacterized protein LOC132272473 n=1 Tax=Cornus florida TaxID=4283 RepID=UPI002899B041|nr:uncharacterized protein LOC132272473 [Cornus florida]